MSITPCIQNDQYGLLVAITNLYSDDIWFNGSAVALDEDGNQIGETYIYEPNLGSGNTAVEVIDCGQTMPDGRVQWTEGQTMEASGTYVRGRLIIQCLEIRKTDICPLIILFTLRMEHHVRVRL